MGEESPARLRFGRSVRLRTGRDFTRIRADGQRLVRGCLIGNWKVLPAGSQWRVGIVTSKKLGNAVVRSRARRLLREVVRLHQHDLAQPIDLILIARHSIVGRKLPEVERDFLSFLKQAKLLDRPIE
jgi:ribonuclease P protein component